MDKLTKEMLTDWGISVVIAGNQVEIHRHWEKNPDPTQRDIVLSQNLRGACHGSANPYLYVHFKVNAKTVNIRVSRLVYAYFNGSIPCRHEIDHIDGNPKNNLPSNLQAICKRENLAKRSVRNGYTAKLTAYEIYNYNMALLKEYRLSHEIQDSIDALKNDLRYYRESFHAATESKPDRDFFREKMHAAENLLKAKTELLRDARLRIKTTKQRMKQYVESKKR